MNQNLLFDILAILIGFAGIMLVLSLLVTALTQAIVHLFSIRAGNLKVGLKELLDTARGQLVDPGLVRAASDHAAKRAAKDEALAIAEALKKAKVPSEAIAIAEENCAKAQLTYDKAENARNELSTSRLSPDTISEAKSPEKYDPQELAESILKSNSLIERGKIRFLPRFMAPKTSWVLKEELEMLLLEQRKELSTDIIEKVMYWFSRMERKLKQRFNLIVRCITLGCALFIAAIFQVSAPDVLKDLSTDPQYRSQAELAAVKLLNEYNQDYRELITYQDVSAKALEHLERKYPTLQETLEEVSGIGNTKDAILDELSLVLEGHPKRQVLLREYESTLENLHRKGYEQAARIVKESVGTLALFDIVPLSKGAGFYLDISNVLGMLMTAVLIGLGAPFWFNVLRRLVSLRDVLAPKDEDTKLAKKQK
ncbi:MAG: hypothetical protein ACYTEL_07055 [Planctomycetota bacterium]|jgi:hypothetical protein